MIRRGRRRPSGGPHGTGFGRARRGSVIVGALVVSTAALLTAGVGPAAASVPTGNRPTSARSERVLLVSLPGVAWSDVLDAPMPNLRRFVARAAVADLSTRVRSRSTPLADGYATVGAGARAVGVPATDGDGRMATERFGATTAGAVYEQRTGRSVDGAIVEVGLPVVRDANAALAYDGVVGSFGTALRAAGLTTAVVANADGLEPDAAHGPADATPPPAFQRQAVLALMDRAGQVDAGQVDPDLLIEDDAAPFGVRLDPVAVEAAFVAAWGGRAAVLVEASDLVRVGRYRPYVTDAEHSAMRRRALRDFDRLFGRLLGRVDLRRDLVVVFGPAHAPDEITLTPLAVRGPGVQPGLLRTPATRRAGFAQLQDVAPFVLDAVGATRPQSMEGRPGTVVATGTAASRLDALERADLAGRFRDDRIGQVYAVLVGFVAATMLLGARARRRGDRRSRFAARLVATWSIGLLAGAFLVRALPTERWGALGFLAAWLGVGLAVTGVSGGVGRAVRRRGAPVGSLAASCAVVVGILAVEAVRGAPFVMNSVLGYSATVAGRFSGFGNPAFAAFSASALVLAVLLRGWLPGRVGLGVAATVLALGVVVDVAPFLGADVGGILSMVPAYAVTLVVLWGGRVRLRAVLAAVAAVVVVGVLAVLVDVARPVSERTHLGRLAVDLAHGRFQELTDVVARKLGAGLASVPTSLLGLIVVATVIGLLILRRRPGAVAGVRRIRPSWRAADLGMLVLAVLGFATNDSGMTVPGIMLVVYVAAWVHLLVGMPAPRAVPGAAASESGPPRVPEAPSETGVPVGAGAR